MKKLVIAVLCLLVIGGCATSTFTSYPEGAKIHIAKTDISGVSPIEGRVPRTTFGKYFVKVTKNGGEHMYGILPLRVSGGVILLDALFLAPAAFFNVQGPFSFYEFDTERNVIKYKWNPEDQWMEYKIPEVERDWAKSFYGE